MFLCAWLHAIVSGGGVNTQVSSKGTISEGIRNNF